MIKRKQQAQQLSSAACSLLGAAEGWGQPVLTAPLPAENSSSDQRQACKKHELYVSFRDLGWQVRALRHRCQLGCKSLGRLLEIEPVCGFPSPAGKKCVLPLACLRSPSAKSGCTSTLESQNH